LIHMAQYDRRGGDDAKSFRYVVTGKEDLDMFRQYLSNADEISAYAHDVFFESKSFGIPWQETITYETFSGYFDNDFSNPAMRKVVKEIIRWQERYEKVKYIIH